MSVDYVNWVLIQRHNKARAIKTKLVNGCSSLQQAKIQIKIEINAQN